MPLAEVATEARDKRRVEPDEEYPIAGVLGFGRGVLLRPAVRVRHIGTVPYRIRTGQLVYSRLKAFEGAFARPRQRRRSVRVERVSDLRH